jgi:hypothetical protein
MKKIKLFLDPVLYYMEDTSGFANPCYIDLVKGEIVSPELGDDVTEKDVKDEERYFAVEPIATDDVYAIMQDFAAMEDSDEIRDHLFSALERKKPFLNFKEALSEYPDTEKRFYQYKGNRFKKMLKKQLAERGYALEEAAH